MQPMYPGKVNSPQTELAGAITDTDTTIPLLDASVLPDPPNLATIGTGEDAETILYTGVSGNDLTGVTRGFQGAAKSWGAGVKVARLFTEYDYDALRQNILSHASRHAAGGPDEITPESIGAETPAGAQAKVDALAGEGNTKTVKQLDDELAAHLADYASNAIKTTGDWAMTGKLTVPEFELTNYEVVKNHDFFWNDGVQNQKIDIEIPKAAYYGSLEVTVSGSFNVVNAIGTITKIIHAGLRSDGIIDKNESFYLVAPLSHASDYLAISDIIFDPVKDKYVIKIVNRQSSRFGVNVIVKARPTTSPSAQTARNITFSPIYATDPTTYEKPYRTGVIVESGQNANGNYVRFADGTQICWREVSFPLSDLQQGYTVLSYPYPAQFDRTFSNPSAFASVSVRSSAPNIQNEVVLHNGPRSENATSWDQIILNRISTNGTGQVVELNLFAIGRWK